MDGRKELKEGNRKLFVSIEHLFERCIDVFEKRHTQKMQKTNMEPTNRRSKKCTEIEHKDIVFRIRCATFWSSFHGFIYFVKLLRYP